MCTIAIIFYHYRIIFNLIKSWYNDIDILQNYTVPVYSFSCILFRGWPMLEYGIYLEFLFRIQSFFDNPLWDIKESCLGFCGPEYAKQNQML